MSLTAFSRAVQKLWERWLSGGELDPAPLVRTTDSADIAAIKTETDKIDDIKTETDKIDDAATDGLSGTQNSLAYRIDEIETHLHHRERWFGKSADQSGDNWAADTLTPYQAISGNNDYGSDANDEAKVLGSDDTPVITGSQFYDVHRILIVDASSDDVYKLRFAFGTSTLAAAVAAGDTTEIMIKFDSISNVEADFPFDVAMPRVPAGYKLWCQVWNATDNATVDFFIGLHEYEG